MRGSSHSLSILTGTIATGCSKTVISIACGVIILPVIARISITGPSPYLTLTVSVAAKKTSGITSLAHLDGSKTIAVIAGSVSERRLLAGDLEISPDVQIKSYGSAELCKAALAKGYVDCWMADVQSLDRLVAQYPGVYRVFADNVMTVDLGVAFDDSYEGEYVKNLDTALSDMDRDGTIEHIVDNYKAGATTGGQGAES